MQYKYEIHTHTKEASNCAKWSAKELVETYVEAGYSGVVITDHLYSKSMHYNPEFTHGEVPAKSCLRGYYAALEAAKGYPIKVFPGIELRFDGMINDYLVYAEDINELENLSDATHWKLADFSVYAKRNNILVIQAHPFRTGQVVTDPSYVDGIEIFNGHPDWDSRNDIAYMWALKAGKIRTSGSDAHSVVRACTGGLISTKKIETMSELIALIKSNPTLIIS